MLFRAEKLSQTCFTVTTKYDAIEAKSLVGWCRTLEGSDSNLGRFDSNTALKYFVAFIFYQSLMSSNFRLWVESSVLKR